MNIVKKSITINEDDHKVLKQLRNTFGSFGNVIQQILIQRRDLILENTKLKNENIELKNKNIEYLEEMLRLSLSRSQSQSQTIITEKKSPPSNILSKQAKKFVVEMQNSFIKGKFEPSKCQSDLIKNLDFKNDLDDEILEIKMMESAAKFRGQRFNSIGTAI